MTETRHGSLHVPAEGPIIVVDDGEIDRFLMARVVQEMGFPNKVLLFASGSEFLVHLRGVVAGLCDFPALVLLDVNMPTMGGFEVLADLRARPEFARRPAVAMVTNLPTVDHARRAGELGADRLIEKDGGFSTLAEELRASLRPMCA